MSDDNKTSIINMLRDDRPENNYDTFLEDRELQLEPVAGDKIVGQLTDTEKTMYRNLIGIEVRIDELLDDITSQANLMIASDIVKEHGSLSDELIKRLYEGRLGEEFAGELFFLKSLHTFKKAEFWFRVRKRLQTFANFLSIREGYNVVSEGSKLHGR